VVSFTLRPSYSGETALDTYWIGGFMVSTVVLDVVTDRQTDKFLPLL